MLDCNAIHKVMRGFEACKMTASGTVVTTHCLYPSFEPVMVAVVGYGDGFVVHDDGGASCSAWSHGASKTNIGKALKASSARYGCDTKGDQITCQAPSKDWLWSAIVSVANASSEAAYTLVRKEYAEKKLTLIEKTKAVFDRAQWKHEAKLEYPYPGKSGKLYTFDLAVLSNGQTALIDAVSSHPNSIASKYLAFSDTPTHPGLFKYAVYEGELEPQDKVLLSNVADVISYNSISGTDGQFLLQ